MMFQIGAGAESRDLRSKSVSQTEQSKVKFCNILSTQVPTYSGTLVNGPYFWTGSVFLSKYTWSVIATKRVLLLGSTELRPDPGSS